MNWKATIALLIVFAVLLIGVIVMQQQVDSAALATATPNPSAGVPVWSVSADQITGLQVTQPATGRSLSLGKDAQGVWAITTPEAKPADQQRVNTTLNNLVSLSASRVITQATDLTEYGLLTPAYVVELKLADGSQLKAALGNKTPTGANYYILRDGATTPLVVSSAALESVVGMLDNPPYPPTPTPAATLEPSPPAPTPTAP